MFINLCLFFITRSLVMSRNVMEALNMEACSTHRQRETLKHIQRGANGGLLNQQTSLEVDKTHVQPKFPRIICIIISTTTNQMLSVKNFLSVVL